MSEREMMIMHDNTNEIWLRERQDQNNSFNNISPISIPPPAASGGPASLPSHLRFPPPELTPSRSSSPSQASPTSLSGSFKFETSGTLTRAASVVSHRQTQSVSSPQRMSFQRSSRSDISSQVSEDSHSAPRSSTASVASSRRHKATKSSAFAGFFTGSSEVVSSFNSSTKRAETASIVTSSTAHSRRPSHARSAGSNLTSAAASIFSRGRTSPSKLSILSSPKQTPKEDRPDFGTEHDDEFLNLQIDHELFPHACDGFDGISGTPEEAFEALLANAERLFMRMQIAYQAKHEALMVLKGRRAEDEEELEEAQERNKHLKAQIDHMGCTVRDQEDALQKTVVELQNEKELRRAEATKRVRSVRIVRAEDGAGFNTQSTASEGRSSFESSGRGSSDSGTVWSRPESRSSGSVSTMPEDMDIPSFEAGTFGGGLREENIRLKARVAELEETVDGCLGLVHGL